MTGRSPALVELTGPGSRIYAVDRDAATIEALQRVNLVGVIPVVADFTRPFDLPGLGKGKLDGILLANALHFVQDAEGVLARLAARLRPGGRVVVVEYDERPASRWVPYPVSARRLAELARSAGLSGPTVTATTKSAFAGRLYVATADRPASGAGTRRARK